MIDKLLGEAKDYIKKGDPVQASEKIYKTVEECVKLLAEKNRIEECNKAKQESRWFAYLLSKAASKLSFILKEEKIKDVWARAYELHVWGFHENKLSIEEVAHELPYIEWLVNYTKNEYTI